MPTYSEEECVKKTNTQVASPGSVMLAILRSISAAQPTSFPTTFPRAAIRSGMHAH
jgi:hypothetical protein